MEQPKVINNISERVIDDLKAKLSAGSCVSIAAASFSIYAFEALKHELRALNVIRNVLGKHSDEYIDELPFLQKYYLAIDDQKRAQETGH